MISTHKRRFDAVYWVGRYESTLGRLSVALKASYLVINDVSTLKKSNQGSIRQLPSNKGNRLQPNELS